MYRKLISAGGVITLSSIYQQALGVLTVGILASYLSPEDFGLIAMVAVFNTFCSVFANVGFGQALINYDHVSEAQKSTLFWLGLFLGGVSFVLIFLSAPLASDFFGYEELEDLIVISSVVFLLRPLFILQRRLYEKEMRFAFLAALDVTVVTFSGLVGIALAVLGFGVVSLVIQSVALNVLYLFALWFFSPWKPCFVFSLEPVKPLIFYSIRYKVGETVAYFEKNIDLVILSKMLDAKGLGYYSFVARIVSAPVKRVSQVVVTVLFPYFSKVKEDDPLDKLLVMTKLLLVFVFPLMSVLSWYSEKIVGFFFGGEWLVTAQYFRVMLLACAFQALDTLLSVYYPAVRKEKLYVKLSVVKFIVTTVFVFIGGMFGVYYACLAFLLSKALNYSIGVFFLYKNSEMTPADFRELLVYMFGVILIACPVVIFVFECLGDLKIETIPDFLAYSVLAIVSIVLTVLLKKRKKHRVGI